MASSDPPLPEAAQRQLQLFSETEDLLRGEVQRLEKELRTSKRVAVGAVLLVLLVPFVLALLPLPMRLNRLRVSELVVDSGGDTVIAAYASNNESRLQFLTKSEVVLDLAADSTENHIVIAGFAKGSEGIALRSGASSTELSLNHNRSPGAEPGEGVARLISDGDGGRAEVIGKGGRATLGGRTPSLELTSGGAKLTASAGSDANLHLEHADRGSADISTSDEGARLTLAHKFRAELYALKQDAGMRLTGPGPSELFVASNRLGQGPEVFGTHPDFSFQAGHEGLKVTRTTGGKVETASLSPKPQAGAKK